MATAGYSYLRENLGLGTLPVIRPAVVRPVTRIQPIGTEISIPASSVPTDTPIAHALFALKHEGTDLAILAAACPRLDAAELLAALRETPRGIYVRKLCFLWEQFTGRQLEDLPADVGRNAVSLFDPADYLTGTPVRNRRWALDFNGLGDFSHCPSVRRTPAIQTCLASDPLGAARAFLQRFTQAQLDRVLGWAYLHETRSTYELEGEAPPGNKAEAYAAILRQAHERHAITEEFLTELQNAVVTSQLAREAAFRHTQNHLSNGAPGSVGVSYVPPPAPMLPSLIASIGRLANGELCPNLDPLVRATLVSFGFVFAHPFLDGNGRLSRFLAHYTLCQSGALPDGYILPLSVAMKRNEAGYLNALQSFSRPARDLWSVLWLDRQDFQFNFKGHEAIYRFWDATTCVEFMYRMAEESLSRDLHGEVDFLACYDSVLRDTDARFDVPGSVLSQLITMIYQNGGVLSKNRRKQFVHQVPAEALDYIEARVRSAMPETEGLAQLASPADPTV